MSEVVLKVKMPCEGCVGAVRRVLTKVPGVESVDISLQDQKVVVKGSQLSADALVATVQKTGKATELWQ